MNPPFVTDGCSGPRCAWRIMNLVLLGYLGVDPPYRWACDIHDAWYRRGGTWADRHFADRQLGERMREVLNNLGYTFLAKWFPWVAITMIRAFGGPWGWFSFSWAFGRPWRERSYRPVTPDERKARTAEIAAWHEYIKATVHPSQLTAEFTA